MSRNGKSCRNCTRGEPMRELMENSMGKKSIKPHVYCKEFRVRVKNPNIVCKEWNDGRAIY